MSWRPRSHPPKVEPTRELVILLDDKALITLLRHSDQLSVEQYHLVNTELQQRLKLRRSLNGKEKRR